MDMTAFLGEVGLGLPLGLATIGSALGIGAAGRAAAGAWGKEAKAGKRLSFTYLILLGLPLSQTIYGFILMLAGLQIKVFGDDTVASAVSEHAGAIFGIGLACGLAELFSAWMQGLIGASAVRALSEGEGKGMLFMIIAMGIAETVGLFGMAFMFIVLGAF